ncbi:MAG: hypothetical protein AAGI28_10650 [Pseudomonadota bacterium]
MSKSFKENVELGLGSPLFTAPHLPSLLASFLSPDVENPHKLSAEIEKVTIKSLTLASTHMHSLGYHYNKVDNISSFRVDDLISARATVRIAMINRKRMDVPRPDTDHEDLKRYALAWEKTHCLTGLQSNPNADEGYAYNPLQWQDEIISSLKAAIKKGAQIISFGEYDFPIYEKLADERSFVTRIQKVLDGALEPIIALIGTSHVFKKDHETAGSLSGDEYYETSLQNVGRLFFSEALRDAWVSGSGNSPEKIFKATPASRVGERLSSARSENRIKLYGYNTVLGRVAVLICSDAYDPTIILEIAAKCADPNLRPNYILVPSYNASLVFPDLCQILSFVTRSIVILVDACAYEHKEKRATRRKELILAAQSESYVPCEEEKSQIWVAGIPMQDFDRDEWSKLQVCKEHDNEPFGNTTISYWDVDNLAYQRLLDLLDDNPAAPTFNAVMQELRNYRGSYTQPE